MKTITRFKQQLLFGMCFTMLLTIPVYSFANIVNEENLEMFECNDCEGKITTLTLQYTGDLNDASILVKQKKGDYIIFDDLVSNGETFTFTGVDKKGTLGTVVLIYINGILVSEIHTSCSVPIGPGMIFGDFVVVAGASLHGGNLCPFESEEVLDSDACNDCEGKITTLTLQYTGDLNDASILVKQKKGDYIIFDDIVANGGTFTFTGVDKKGTLGTVVFIYINGILVSEIHTSCSVPIGPGMIFGDFVVVAGASLHGGDLCPIESEETPCDVSVSEDLINCPAQSASLIATGGNSYLWNTGETTASITKYPTQTTTYSVVITTSTCVVTKEITVTILFTNACGVSKENPILTLYPTAVKAQDDIHLSFDVEQLQDIAVTVYDLYGRQIHTYKNLSYTTDKNKRTLPLGAIPNMESGIYFITVSGNGWFKTKRILIE